jgi:hypothetical protein
MARVLGEKREEARKRPNKLAEQFGIEITETPYNEEDELKEVEASMEGKSASETAVTWREVTRRRVEAAKKTATKRTARLGS